MPEFFGEGAMTAMIMRNDGESSRVRLGGEPRVTGVVFSQPVKNLDNTTNRPLGSPMCAMDCVLIGAW